MLKNITSSKELDVPLSSIHLTSCSHTQLVARFGFTLDFALGHGLVDSGVDQVVDEQLIEYGGCFLLKKSLERGCRRYLHADFET